MQGFSKIKTRGSKSPRMSDFMPLVKLTSSYKAYRPVGPVYAVCQVWFTVKGTTDKKPWAQFPKMCLDFDGESGEFISNVCPYRKMGSGRPGTTWYVNVIDRELQESSNYKRPKGDKEEMLGYECHLTTIQDGGEKRTPVRVLECNSTIVENLQQLQQLNKHKIKTKSGDTKTQTFESSHPKYGFDVNISYDESKKGVAKYSVQKGDTRRLDEEELDFALWKLDVLTPEDLETAKAEAKSLDGRTYTKGKDDKYVLYKKGGKSSDEDEDDGDEDDRPKKKKKIIEDDDEIQMSDDDEDEDDRPKKKSKKGKKSKDADEDEDEDEPKSKKSKRDLEDSDEDEDEDDEDSDEDDESDDEDDGDEDEDDRPKSKKKSKSSRNDDGDDEDEDEPKSKKGKGKSKKSNYDEDEDDEDAPKKKSKRDLDDEEDEDDEPKSKKSKGKKSKSRNDDGDEDEDDAPKKRKRRDEDEDEDDRPKKKAKKRPLDDDED